MSLRVLSNELQEKAIRELNEVPEEVPGHIADIQEWLSERPHLRAKTEAQWLLSFLRGSKFDVQKAKQKLELLYTMRRKTAVELFKDRDPLRPEVQEILNRGIFVPVKNTVDPAGPVLLLMRWKKTDPKEVLFVDLIKVALMMADILINESDGFVICGQQILHDFKGISIRYLTQLTPALLYKSVQVVTNAYPSRIKGVNFSNMPLYMKTAYNMLYMLFSQKLRGRLKAYRGDGLCDDGLYKDIPRDIFPEEYGGKGQSVETITREWKEKVESYRQWFLEDS